SRAAASRRPRSFRERAPPRSCQRDRSSFRIMEDHTHSVALAGTQPADAMPQIDAIDAARSLHRPVMHGEGDRVALLQPDHFGPRLHPWTLLGQDELSALEVAPGLGQQDRDLQRKHMLAIEVLMQAIVVTGLVLQKQRRRTGLAGVVAALQEGVVTI